MSIQDKLATHFEGLVTTSGVVERALRKNPKLIKILEDTIKRIKEGARVDIDCTAQYLAKKIDADRGGAPEGDA